jgi:ribonuclease P protein component
MLAKAFRFHGYGSLKYVYSRGNTVRARFLSMKYIANSRRSQSRLAVVVSKKITKKAPERNRMRRRIYEAVRLEWPHVKPGYDLVITVFDERIGIIHPEDLAKLVRDLLTESGVAVR